MRLIPTTIDVKNRKHVARVQEVLLFLESGIPKDSDEITKKTFGTHTSRALLRVKKELKLPANDRLNKAVIDALNQKAIDKYYSTRTQTARLQKTLVKVMRIAKVESNLVDDLKTRTLGQQTAQTIKAFQKKYQLRETGLLNPETLEKLQSVAASQVAPIRNLKVQATERLTKVRNPLRLNMSSPRIADLQKALSWSGFAIDVKEFNARTYGKTTRNAVIEFQKKNALPVTGNVGWKTAQKLNSVIAGNAQMVSCKDKYRVRGSVRDETWQGVAYAKVRIFEKKMRQEVLLGERKTLANGFYDLQYLPPVNPFTGKPKDNYQLIVRLYAAEDKVLQERIYQVKGKVLWANFTAGGEAYRGDSSFAALEKILKKVLGNETGIEFIEESAAHCDVSHLRKEAALAAEDIMKMTLAFRVAAHVNDPALSPEVFYAFIRQNQPDNLPGDLLPDKPEEWDGWIAGLVDSIADGIVFTDSEIQRDVINSALKQNYISRSVARNLPLVLAALKQVRVKFVLEKPLLAGSANLQSILAMSSVQTGKHTAIAGALEQAQGFTDDFWQLVAEIPGLNPAAVCDLQATVDLGYIASNHDKTAAFLKSKLTAKKAGPLTKVSDFAKLSQKEWVQLITDNGNQIPAWVEGANLNERRQAYAASLSDRAGELYPAVSLIADVSRSSLHGLGSMTKILKAVEDNLDFELKSDNLDVLLKTTGSKLNKNEVAALKALQRVQRIAPSTRVGVTLLDSGYYSAAQVLRQGKANLAETFAKKGLPKEMAQSVFDAAEHQYAASLAALSKYRMNLQRINPGCIVSSVYSPEEIAELKKDIPDIETLFGSLDTFEVRHCESVLGPSAYLTDLFRFLDEKQSALSGQTVQDVLFARRPDLGTIKLNCQNTDTALPYIDLVCEILENRAVDGTGALNFQSTWCAPELLSEPEHVVPEAYDTLKNADFPMCGSLNLWQEETRSYLAHLGIPRHHLMKTFLFPSTAPAVKLKNELATAAEYFGISPQEQAVIVTARATAAWQKKYWSNQAYVSSMPVSVFLHKTGLEYRDLISLLECGFVNKALPVSIILCPLDNCDLDKQKVTNLTTARMDKINRFLRLWRKTSLRMDELDELIMHPQIGKEKIDSRLLIVLKQFEELRKLLKLGVEELAAFYGPINTAKKFSPAEPARKEKNLFERLFLSGSMDETVYTDFAKLMTTPVSTKNLDAYTQHLLSSFSLNSDDLNLLLPKTDAKLTQDSLGLLFRYTVLARQLQMPLKDLLLFLNLTGIADPFASMTKTNELIEKKKFWQESGVSLVQLSYILTGNPDSPVGLRSEILIQKIQILREALAGLQTKILECEKTGDDKLKMLLAMLKTFADPVVLQTALDLIAGVWTATQAQMTTFITDQMGVFVLDVAHAIDRLKYVAPITGAELNDRRAYVFDELLNYLNRTMVKEFVAVTFALDSSGAAVLLNRLHLQGKTACLLGVLQDAKLYEKDGKNEYVYEISALNFPDMFAALMLLHKAALTVNTLKMNAVETAWFVENSSATQTIDFNQLPILAAQPALAFETWLTLARFIKFKRNFPEPEGASFLNVLAIASSPSGTHPLICAELCKLTTWDLTALLQLDYVLLNYRSPQTYEWFLECFRQRRVTGAEFSSLLAWSRRDQPDQERIIARNVREAVQAKYDHEQWLKILKSILDPLREKKRQALAGYLMEKSQREKPAEITVSGKSIKNPEFWVSPDDLYGWFLIDVEMCSEQLTSRIKQAISSTQLFVQRCFLNLESNHVQVAHPDPDMENNWLQWKWMKNFRIWEANRKVFLFPENWVEPELRDNKSPFFEDLESDILSKEINASNVEESLQRYILKLEEVSKLEVCSVFHEVNAATNLYHVLARTRSMPPAYYYRSYDLMYSRWSAWEKIETDVNSDHVVPFVYNRKLHLFWLIFHEKPIKLKKLPPMQAATEPQINPEPAKYLEIELAWTVRQTDGWQVKKLSRRKLIHPWERPAFSYNIKPRYKSQDNTLWIDLYISTSKAFNDGTFYDQFLHQPVRLTRVSYDETLRPWHSSSFVFNGDVKEIMLRGIPGNYFSPEQGKETIMSSYDFVKQNFGDEGEQLSRLTIISEQLALPAGMHYSYTRLTNNLVKSVNASKVNVFDAQKNTLSLLQGGQSPFEVVMCEQGLMPVNGKIRPLFYQDRHRAFFVRQDYPDNKWGYGYGKKKLKKIYSFYPFYHPFAEVFQQEINRSGQDGLYQRNLQLHPGQFTAKAPFSFLATYQPLSTIRYETAESEHLDFTRSGPYSLYNWELFFHAPLMIACRLSQNQRFEEAMQWFHYIFDPTNTQTADTPQRFWITKPFYETNSDTYRMERISYIIDHIDEFKEQLVEWKNHPFKPHLIAEYRTVAYQKAVVMKYLDNLIAWGDQLFRRETLESINEATLLYVLAGQLLGPRPVVVPALNREDKTFNELTSAGPIDDFGNSKVEVSLENALGLPISYAATSVSSSEPMPLLETSYFGLPLNDKLLQYWDTVRDRLFKIRHGMNIEGLKRQLPLFEPPIDPALLVKAAAAGLDLAAVLNDLNAPAQPYRFRVLAHQAVEFCREVRVLGQQLLAAIEHREAEELATLRAVNEVTMIKTMKRIRELRIEEIKQAIYSLERRRDACQIRIDHIKSLSEQLDAEKKAGDWGTAASVSKIVSQVCNGLAAIISPTPAPTVGVNGPGGTPHATLRTKFHKAFEYSAKVADGIAQFCKWRQDDLKSEAAGERTKAERQSQIDAEEKEKSALEMRQIGCEIRMQMAEVELENFEKEVEVRESEQEYLYDKYTNSQLYYWMQAQISNVYFQAYQLAYDMAKRAEKSYRRELGLIDSSFIQFGYWDSLKKGLLSADRLMQDIHGMESSYLEQHKRELEITKHVSLARLAPHKLLELKATGRCTLDVEEWMYNLDYPGHYRRRIKSVSITVPCGADEYTNVNCQLTLLDNKVRVSNLAGADDYNADEHFIEQTGTGESIATTNCRFDHGVFHLQFDDERFLPFEAAGAISCWDIHMPGSQNQFDFSTLADFILHISYTAQDGGEPLAQAAQTDLDDILSGNGAMVVGLKQAFPAAWETFLNPPAAGSEQKLVFNIAKNDYPFLFRIRDIEMIRAGLAVMGKHEGNYEVELQVPGQPLSACALSKDPSLNNIHYKADIFEGTAGATGTFEVKIRQDSAGSDDFTSLPADDLQDMYLVLEFTQ
jgi:peptidoglycan hydrolase-like protein with peptidoglycan-binding domain